MFEELTLFKSGVNFGDLLWLFILGLEVLLIGFLNFALDHVDLFTDFLI